MKKDEFSKIVIEMLPDPFFAIDKDGRVILWNSAMERLTNIKKEEILGKGDFAHSMAFYGQKRGTLAELVLSPNKETEKHYYRFERFKDGSVEGETYSKKLDYYDWGKAVPILNNDGEIEAVVSLSRDITDLKKYERQQEELLKRYETLFSSSPDGIVCFDKNHIIYDVNQSFTRIFGYTKEECIGRSPDDLVTIKNLRKDAIDITNKLFERGIVDYEDTRYTKDGEAVVVNIRGALIEIGDEIVGGYGIYTDITEKYKYRGELESTNLELEATVEQLTSSEEELRAQYDEIQIYSEKNDELMQKYEIAIEATGSFIWEINIIEKTMMFTKNFIDLVGQRIFKKQNIYEIIDGAVHKDDRDILVNEIKACINKSKETIDVQIRIIDKESHINWYLIRGKFIRTKGRELIHGVLIDINDIKEKEEQIKFLADHDPLTKLYNRRKLTETLDIELGKENKGALVLLDLDNFKKVNDVLGHSYGDKLLKYIANMIKNLAPENSVTFRYGGDEFLILIREENDLKIEGHVQTIRKAFEKTIIVDNLENNITVSMGIVQYPRDGNYADELLLKADIALYTAKKLGKNRFLFYSEEMKEKFNADL